MEARARALVRPISSLGRQEEVPAMLAHPRTDSQFRIAIGGRGVDMVDAVFEQEVEYWISLILFHAPKRCGTKNDACALMAGPSERMFRNHVPPRLSVSRVIFHDNRMVEQGNEPRSPKLVLRRK